VRAIVHKGLRAGATGEWYGPATASAAHRLLTRWAAMSGAAPDGKTIALLRTQALEPIENGKYLGVNVPAAHEAWHAGQVVNEFPAEAQSQLAQIRNMANLAALDDPAQQVYALARVIQGARAASDEALKASAVQQLYQFQSFGRPLGQGIMADTVKGSLNVLDALWPELQPQDKMSIGQLLEALTEAYVRANLVGILVALDRESDALQKTFEAHGAEIKPNADGNGFTANHRNYRAVVRQGKSLIETADITLSLVGHDRAKWVLLSGIAGSLGTTRDSAATSSTGDKVFVGPGVGDLVVATSLAPFRIRDKVRDRIENAPVPMGGETWAQIPVDPTLFGVLHRAAQETFPERTKFRVHEGLIVTGTGIKDNLKEKDAILKEWGGGLAVEEEGYILALICLLAGVPCGVVRAISDLAEGDKIKQQSSGREEQDQVLAAQNAAIVVVAAVETLSVLW
jgi:nucleoside phosphorylase